jgi:glucosyl-dolichyl phosphate glucuronosyltransferase
VNGPEVSVIVCTRNRASGLAETLDSLTAQSLARQRYEVIVVDNWSTDSTRQVAETALEREGLRGRCVLERALGLNNARNRGVEDSRGEIVAFLDDDARALPAWLDALLAAFAAGTPDGVGGPVELVWQAPPPRWQHRDYFRLLAEFDLGAERCAVDVFPYLVGTNMAFTRDTFRRVGLFDPRFDRQGTNLLSMGDTEFCHRVVQSGGHLFYEPRARVRHLVPPDRATLSFLLRRSYSNGRSLRRLKALRSDLDAKPPRPGTLASAVSRLLRRLAERDLVASARLASSVAWHLGYLREGLSLATVPRHRG